MKIREQRGMAAVEFAIVLPVLVLLIFGMIEFSTLLYDKGVITNASREGARAGIVHSPTGVSDAEIVNVVNNYCADNLITFGGPATPTTTISRPSSGSGEPLTVTVDYQYEFLVLPNLVFGLTGPIDLSARTEMRME